MARIVLEFTAINSQNGATTVADPSGFANALINWKTAVPTFFITAGSVNVAGGGATIEGEQVARSDTDFFITGSQRETRGILASFTNLEFYYKFGGYDFEFGNSTNFQQYPTIISTPVLNGTITSLDYEYTVSSGAGSSPVGPYSNTSIFKITATDLSLSAADIDFVKYQDIIPSIFHGDDQIFGSLASDIIEAGAGNDMVYAYDGNDKVYGGTGNDFLNGENGNDEIFGEEGNDLLAGGAGNDLILGGSGNDNLYGNDGDDRLYGEDGNDVLLGSSGNDLIFGGDGRDQLLGDDGNDWLVGGSGNDFMFGGKGDDGFVYDPEDHSDSVGNPNNAYFGGEGFDTLFIDWALVGDQFVVGLNGINLSRREIEQAIVTRNDTDGLPWAQIITVYDKDWRISKYEFVQDNGSKSVWYQDADRSRSWSEIRSFYTADGRLDYEQTYFDNGSSSLLDFDLSNTVIWNSRTLTVSASGAVVSDVFVLDQQIGQRSLEMGDVAKKVFINDALI